jgi:cell division protein FtsB
MARNRKRERNWIRLLPLTKWLLVFAFVATVAVGFVYQKNGLYKLGDDIKAREQQLETLRKRNVVLRDQIAMLTAPRVIEHKCKLWNLGLAQPAESQIVRVPDPMLEPVRAAAPGKLVAVAREVREN